MLFIAVTAEIVEEPKIATSMIIIAVLVLIIVVML